ncbi:hypothetical protein CLU79DRAFT_712803, partial [Phycomyces nitens]
WENIGYIRKSPSNESNEDRVRLLNKMTKMLKNITMCTSVYASPCCRSTSPLVRSDSDGCSTINMLDNINGNMQDLLEVAAKPGRMIRLCVIDFAGLTDDPVDLIKFLRQIKEVVVDNKGKLEIFSRHQIIHEDKLKRFKCRKGPVKRST